jgi:hypothetical protein
MTINFYIDMSFQQNPTTHSKNEHLRMLGFYKMLKDSVSFYLHMSMIVLTMADWVPTIRIVVHWVMILAIVAVAVAVAVPLPLFIGAVAFGVAIVHQ